MATWLDGVTRHQSYNKYDGGPAKTAICIHHMAGNMDDITSAYESRGVSAHFSNHDGHIIQYLSMADRAWHTGENFGNTYAIGIENANCGPYSGIWPVSDATITGLINLLVKIAQAHGWKSLQTTNRNAVGYVFGHRQVNATTCPGDYLFNQIPSLVAKVNAILSAPTVIQASNVWQYAFNGTNAQKWNIAKKDNGFYKIKNLYIGKCLDVAGGANRVGANVQGYYSDNNTKAQEWRLEEVSTPLGVGYIVHSAINDILVLDISGGSKVSTANAQLYTKNGTYAQLFYFIPTGKADEYFIINANSLLPLDIAGGK